MAAKLTKTQQILLDELRNKGAEIMERDRVSATQHLQESIDRNDQRSIEFYQSRINLIDQGFCFITRYIADYNIKTLYKLQDMGYIKIHLEPWRTTGNVGDWVKLI